MGEHHFRFPTLLCSYFVWLPHWSLTTSCFVLSALQYILHMVLKFLINLAVLFFKKKKPKTLFTSKIYCQSYVTTFLLVGTLDVTHPSTVLHMSRLLSQNTSWVLGVVGNSDLLSIPMWKELMMLFLRIFSSLLDE